MQSSDELLSARDTAARLGIKLDTLYAYVSRGLLRSVAMPGSRERGYRIAEVERFRAGRGGDRQREALMPILDTAVCLIDNGRFYYRGHDAIELSETAMLEEVAALLWNTEWAAAPDPGPLAALAEREEPPAKQPAGLIERCQTRLAELGAADMAALDLGRAGVARTGRAILAELVACVANVGVASGPIHARLGVAWRLDRAGIDLVRRCLVLLADHELNASTFVARVVASTGATPYAVVAAALAALSGRRHGGASARAEAMLREIGCDGDPLSLMAARLARGETLPGIGQPLYPGGDPRATAILATARTAIPARRGQLKAAADAAQRLTGEHPNVDFALAAAVTALDLPPGSALALFVIGRAVGWIAHAIEQYDTDILIRPRARYVGRRPA